MNKEIPKQNWKNILLGIFWMLFILLPGIIMEELGGVKGIALPWWLFGIAIAIVYNCRKGIQQHWNKFFWMLGASVLWVWLILFPLVVGTLGIPYSICMAIFCYKRRGKIGIGSAKTFLAILVSYIATILLAAWIFEGPIAGSMFPFYSGKGIAASYVEGLYGEGILGTIRGYVLHLGMGYGLLMCLIPFLLTMGHPIRRFLAMLASFWWFDYMAFILPGAGAHGTLEAGAWNWAGIGSVGFLFGTTIPHVLHSIVNALVFVLMFLAIYYPLKGSMFRWRSDKSYPPTKQLGQKNNIRWLGMLLGIMGILTLIGLVAFCPNATHAHVGGHSGMEFIIVGTVLMVFGASVTYGITKPIKEIENLCPSVNTGAGLLGGILGIIGVADGMTRWGEKWGMYLVIVACLLAIFISLWIYMKEKSWRKEK